MSQEPFSCVIPPDIKHHIHTLHNHIVMFSVCIFEGIFAVVEDRFMLVQVKLCWHR